MRRVSLLLAGAVPLLLVGVASGQGPPPDRPKNGDETNPALLKGVRELLGRQSGLRPVDGLFIETVEYFRGVVRVAGKARAEEQRAGLLRALEAARPRLEREVDIRITSFDLTRLVVEKAPDQPSKPPPSLPPQVPAVPSPALPPWPPATLFPAPTGEAPGVSDWPAYPFQPYLPLAPEVVSAPAAGFGAPLVSFSLAPDFFGSPELPPQPYWHVPGPYTNLAEAGYPYPPVYLPPEMARVQDKPMYYSYSGYPAYFYHQPVKPVMYPFVQPPWRPRIPPLYWWEH